MLQMQLPGEKRRGRPKRRHLGGLNEDMKEAGVTVKDASDISAWKKKRSAEATPNWDKSKGEDLCGRLIESCCTSRIR